MRRQIRLVGMCRWGLRQRDDRPEVVDNPGVQPLPGFSVPLHPKIQGLREVAKEPYGPRRRGWLRDNGPMETRTAILSDDRPHADRTLRRVRGFFQVPVQKVIVTVGLAWVLRPNRG